MKKTIIAIFLAELFLKSTLFSANYQVVSPDGQIYANITVNEDTRYEVYFKKEIVISSSSIAVTLENGQVLGKNDQVKKVIEHFVSAYEKPVLPRKYSNVLDEFSELQIDFKNNYSLVFRAYNDGVAYRWKTAFADSIIIQNELVSFNFPQDAEVLFPEEESKFSHQERLYVPLKLSQITSERFCSTGMLVKLHEGTKIFLSESDLEDYPGMYLKGTAPSGLGLRGKFAAYPLHTKQLNDRSVIVSEYADYIAKTNGARYFPWRVMIIADTDAALLESEMIWKLAKPNQLADVSWIKPGKVAWDWWNALNVYGVDFESGVNTETYKYYIDFAHDFGLQYIILDEGWYYLDNVLKVKEDVNINEIVSYAESKNVGVILWVTWKALDDQLDHAMAQFQNWGTKGIKVDFMQRDDQWMVNYYYKVAKKAAEHKLIVDFHGSYKPTGLYRTYPNVITSEGVVGLENNKWSKKVSPGHDVTLPFIRMVAGPMDYTPGAMINANQDNFRDIFNEPMSQGTRCHQLAMYVVFESPLQMLADNPSNYRREKECMEFLSAVPVTWDDLRVLDAKVSEYIILARKKENTWFLGAMTDWAAREMTIDFQFLDDGDYSLEIWQDGLNADKHAADFKKIRTTVNNKSKIAIHLASGGGWVAIASPIDNQ